MELLYRGRHGKEQFDGTTELDKLYSVKPVEIKRMDKVRICADSYSDIELIDFLKKGIIPKLVK